MEALGKRQGPESSHTDPPSKRRRYFEPDDSDSDSESDEGFDLESYYDSATEDRTAEDVQKFISVAFKRCLAHQKRKELENFQSHRQPKPQKQTHSLQISWGSVIQDKQLSRIQTSILAACAPLTDLWSRLCDQGLSGEEDELIPVEEVLKVIRASVALIGNSSNYVSQLRRKTIIEALPADKANLAKIMKQVCRRQIENTGPELFGDQAIKAVSERVNTLETFSKTASRSEVKLRQQPKSFFEGARPPRTGAVRAQQEHRTFHSETALSKLAAGLNLEFSTPGIEPVHLSGKVEAHSYSGSPILNQASTVGVNPASRREVEISSNSMERNLRLKLDSTNSQRLSTRVSMSTPFNPPTTAAPTICSTAGNTRSGGAQSVAEKSHRGMSRPRRLLQFPFYRPQKGWWMANHHQSEKVEQISTDSAFQDGISILGQGCTPERGLDGQVGSPGCLPYSTCIPTSQEIPKVSMENTDIPVPVPSLWFGHGSQSLYKTHETSSDLPQTARDQASPVSGRVPRSTQDTLEKGSKPARGTRFLTQQEEVCLNTNPENRVLEIRGGLNHHAPLPSIQEAG